MNHAQIIECAKELGFDFNQVDAEDILTTASWAYETVWEAVTDYLNAYETCKDFDQPKYRRTRNKWSKAK